MRPYALILVAVAACEGDPACPLSDDRMREGLVLFLEWPEDRLPGRYEILARADGVELALAFDWDGAFGRCSQAPRCMLDAIVDGPLGKERLVFEVDRPRQQLLIVGYDENEHGGPEVVEIEVRAGSRTVGRETFTPTYTYRGSPECSSAYLAVERLAISP